MPARAEPEQPAGSHWRDASHAIAVEFNLNPPKDHHNLEIEQIFYAPADIEIHKAQYPEGVMIVNENPRPPDRDPQIADENPHPGHDFEFRIIPHGQDFVHVHIKDNDGWPTGKIIIWERLIDL